jgi:hypothetical protein
MVEEMKHSKVRLFADDTLIYISGENYTDTIKNLNEDLQMLTYWLQKNKLKLNISKTNFMNIGHKHIPTECAETKIKIEGNDVKGKNDTKYLGVILDN